MLYYHQFKPDFIDFHTVMRPFFRPPRECTALCECSTEKCRNRGNSENADADESESSDEDVESDVSDDENQDHQDTDEDVDMQSDEDFDSNIFDILDSF